MNKIPSKRSQALGELRQNQRKFQLERFLDRFQLEDAKIDGIGAGRKRTLESYRIETAEDITPFRLQAVPGFGPKMIERLMRWRRSIEANFVFDPTKEIDPRDIVKVEQDILSLRTRIEATARVAYSEAMESHTRIMTFRQNLRPHIESLQFAVAQARADYEFVKS